MRIITSFIGATIILLVSAACSVESDPGPEPEYSRTIVFLQENGSGQVYVEQVTLAQQLADRDAEELAEMKSAGNQTGSTNTVQEAITLDTGCATSSLRIWDQTNYTGNQICFYGNGTADLSFYCRTYLCIGQWNDHVRSFKSGNQWGFFNSSSGNCCSGCASFATGTNRATATGCEQGADDVTIGACNPC